MGHPGGAALPAPARAIAAASQDAVVAARAADREAFAEAGGRLAAQEPEQVRLVLGEVVRSLLEELHPDGLGADDLEELLRRCQGSARSWWPELDPRVLVIVLTGALGVHGYLDGPEPVAPMDPGEVARHAVLLIAELLGPSRGSLQPYLRRAFDEIARAETVEQP